MRLNYKIIPDGSLSGMVPLNIILVDKKETEALGLSYLEACQLLARAVDGPAGINIFDLEACTTTSDGIMVDSALVAMAASDRGKIHREFGYLEMAEIARTSEILAAEPHLGQWDINFKGKKLFRGPAIADKKIPVHNAVISGRAANNNSATEMMQLVTMGEILLPYIGQRQLMTGGDVLVGLTGEVISVGIGMTVKEKWGRVFATPQYGAGDTAHGSGEYAKTLKRDIPCIVADKRTHAKYTMMALEAGMVPGRDIGCSPAVLSIARALDKPIAFDNITEKAWAELSSVGFTREALEKPRERLAPDQILERAEEILPGVDGPRRYRAEEVAFSRALEV